MTALYAQIIMFALVFYWGFAASISVYRLWLAGKLNAWNELAFIPLLFCFAMLDIILNYTLCLVVMGLPPAHCYTISARLEYYHRNYSGWRSPFATWVCERLLNALDPTGAHC